MTDVKDFVVVIPVRMESKRLPNKPVLLINGISMIHHTYKRACEAVDQDKIYIATDSLEIKQLSESFGAQVIMTSRSCMTGTDRVAEFAQYIQADCYINLQGDEPLMDPKNIRTIIEAARREPDAIHNGWREILDQEEFFSRSIPKLVMNSQNELIYMSRSPIPGTKTGKFKGGKKQICLYSFSPRSLELFRSHPQKTSLEMVEDIEILRFLELNLKVKLVELPGDSIAVDTESDLEKVRKIMSNKIN